MDQQIKVDLLLSDYEEVAAQAVDNGIDLTTQVFFSFMHLLRFNKIWMKVWDRSYNSGFLSILLPCVKIYFDFYIHFLFVFSSPSDLTALSLLEEFTFSLFCCVFLKLRSPFWFLNSLLKEFTANWNYIQSVFFSTTILTTIGEKKKEFWKMHNDT